MIKSPHASNKVYGSLPRMAGFKNRGYYGVDPEEDYIEMLDDDLDDNNEEFDKTKDEDLNIDTDMSEESEQAQLVTMYGHNWEYRL